MKLSDHNYKPLQYFLPDKNHIQHLPINSTLKFPIFQQYAQTQILKSPQINQGKH